MTFKEKALERGRIEQLRERIIFITEEVTSGRVELNHYEPEWGRIAKELDEWEARNATKMAT
ncbi:MAG TPA: hypothetical protein VMS08_04990 [Candidatus Saccharimonadia bacterium]|nr:hypothetical protein [Candidatus Saccharimonadia bacterium]